MVDLGVKGIVSMFPGLAAGALNPAAGAAVFAAIGGGSTASSLTTR